jgi:succinoglycan biosynthesis protein ExoM
MLGELLDSLAQQTIFNTGTNVEIVIVDNDEAQSAGPIFNLYSGKFSCEIQYLHEMKRGIPFARNKVLDHAIDRQAEFIAFIDDDETADPDWLQTLHQIITSEAVDAVQGPVITLLPENAPSWAIQEANKKSNRKEGEKKTALATNNVIFSSSLIVEKGLRFDERFALSGGSDIDFFQRSAQLGSRHIWTNQALVYEKIPGTRLTLKWEFQRSFRVGATNTYSSVQQKGLGYGIKRYMLKIIARLLLGPLILITAGIFSAKMRLLAIRWIGSAVGHFLGFFGILGSEYSNIHGD